MLALAATFTPSFVAPTTRVARVEGRVGGVEMLGRRDIATLAFGAVFAGASSANAMGGDQSKIGVSRVEIPSTSTGQGDKLKKGAVDTSGWTTEGKCTSPLQCWADYPGKTLREGTCGIGKKCPPAVKTTGTTLSPFGINEGAGDSYTNQGSKTPPPAPPPAPAE
jgi:hypothetical protein